MASDDYRAGIIRAANDQIRTLRVNLIEKTATTDHYLDAMLAAYDCRQLARLDGIDPDTDPEAYRDWLEGWGDDDDGVES